MVAGPRASANPWKANSLEWSTASPPPHYNFDVLPRVFHPPYEYSVPGAEEDYLPQTSPLPPNITLDPVMA
jgi:cytochrome c oxidase subunit 1